MTCVTFCYKSWLSYMRRISSFSAPYPSATFTICFILFENSNDMNYSGEIFIRKGAEYIVSSYCVL